MLVACLRFIAERMCPRCLIRKDQVPFLGTKADERAREQVRRDDLPTRVKIDSARHAIFLQGKGVKSARVERILKPWSMIPNRVRILFNQVAGARLIEV